MSQTNFDHIVRSSVQEAMSEMMGSEVWKAISFYFDVRTVAQDPGSFQKLLDKLFGLTSKVLQQSIGNTLLSKVGGESDDPKGKELKDWIQIAKAKFFGSASWAFQKTLPCSQP